MIEPERIGPALRPPNVPHDELAGDVAPASHSTLVIMDRDQLRECAFDPLGPACGQCWHQLQVGKTNGATDLTAAAPYEHVRSIDLGGADDLADLLREKRACKVVWIAGTDIADLHAMDKPCFVWVGLG